MYTSTINKDANKGLFNLVTSGVTPTGNNSIESRKKYRNTHQDSEKGGNRLCEEKLCKLLPTILAFLLPEPAEGKGRNGKGMVGVKGFTRDSLSCEGFVCGGLF